MLFAHQITYPELAAAKVPVVTVDGEMIGGPDRKSESDKWKWLEWQRAVSFASRDPKAVPQAVMDYFQATKHLSRHPQPGDMDIMRKGPLKDRISIEEAVIIETQIPEIQMNVEALSNNAGFVVKGFTPPANFKPPRFTWSYTSMQEFLTCPAQWAAKRYWKTIKEGESEAMRVGNLIHETAEHYLKWKIGQTFSQNKIHSQYLPQVQKYCDALVASGAELHVEREMCFDQKFKPCGWKDWNTVYVRSKADVLAKKGNKISLLDWKTGKYKEDFLQLKMFAVFSALTPGFEDVQEFDPKFIFTKEAPPKNILRLPKPILRAELKGVLTEILQVVRRMEAAWESETFPCKKNGLCKNYCLNNACLHCG